MFKTIRKWICPNQESFDQLAEKGGQVRFKSQLYTTKDQWFDTAEERDRQDAAERTRAYCALLGKAVIERLCQSGMTIFEEPPGNYYHGSLGALNKKYQVVFQPSHNKRPEWTISEYLAENVGRLVLGKEATIHYLDEAYEPDDKTVSK